ncbi:30S ribosomal protein S12 methylthiotransferase RimO [Adlercreutzia caecimuris]|uniref:30S ribosomal protein S12 methylthiotransferase RimO n=1 Tax=Adlercreutzia caecimuris TaxID=671266 RepID=UPI0020CC9F0D|nr:30S ribosomal protein S12 methylthiotransferase RimO [Adlercreutzia caecimuris]MCR2036551.1 30S ribosomal protein S12 methylthiotransferase RimO [Adlercreutzia caecimuris]
MTDQVSGTSAVATAEPCGRISLITMGCAKNEVDSAAMARALSEAGYDTSASPDEADVVIVNTCSFIQSATEESLEAIFEAAALPAVERGDAALIVAGCMPARYGDDLAEELTEARAFVPCSKEDDIVAVVDGILGYVRGAEPLPRTASAPAQAGPVFAYVKISDGCDRFCSYCTIPAIRGRYHSFPFEDIYREVERARADGAREIDLIAQDTGRWGQDLPGDRDLAWLVNELSEAFPDTWFRVMYLQPEGVTDALLSVMAVRDNVCPYLDIPLQHVSAPLLRAMNRAGSAEKFHELIERIRAAVPDITLRTTLIAGFPGETDEQFEALCDFVAEEPFDYVGVFPYSREEGTAAFDLPGQLDEEEKAERAQVLRDAADACCVPRIAERIGRVMPVLVEGCEEDGQRYGRAQCQAPEVDGVTFVSEGEPGDVVEIVIADTLLYEMEGE